MNVSRSLVTPVNEADVTDEDRRIATQSGGGRRIFTIGSYEEPSASACAPDTSLL